MHAKWNTKIARRQACDKKGVVVRVVLWNSLCEQGVPVAVEVSVSLRAVGAVVVREVVESVLLVAAAAVVRAAVKTICSAVAVPVASSQQVELILLGRTLHMWTACPFIVIAMCYNACSGGERHASCSLT